MTEKILNNNLETIKYIDDVRANLYIFITDLIQRAKDHDASKLQSPEQEIFSEYWGELGKVEYGSEKYKKLLEKVKPAIDHHYSKNRHHPEHFSDGIRGMDILDVVEMLADWSAATKRNKNGNIHKSIEHNKTRFNISEDLVAILENTVNRYF